MKEIIHNKDNLKDEEINDISIRAKALLISDNNIYLGNERDIYQFPGGHLEEGESLKDCLKREVLEEVGIEIDDNEIKDPFMKAIFMNRNWPKEGINRKTEFNYYVINTNNLPDLNKVNYTEHEKEGNYRIDIIPLDEVIEILEKNIFKNEKNKVIAPDMIEAINEYLKIKQSII